MRKSIYYLLKPYLPWRLRLEIRRLWALRVLQRHQHVWPIDESAGKHPPRWPGWPDGHRFAVVLTHDVEGPEGLARVRQLAELEMSAGFRSSFNFIPEGSYRVSDELRGWLAEHGFEVGVHDLYHDGKLYASRGTFRRHAARINRHLRDWGAAGFRSGFMHHNLEWLHDLEISYDASTFDTDPFEPQPDGVGTIFPFWVPAPSEKNSPLHSQPSTLNSSPRGYVELPYTLPQDSTLFQLLREADGRLWNHKVDWIARHGGMVLVNVHPDYVEFSAGEPVIQRFPSQHYLELLKYLRERYDGQFWQAPPKDVAQWYRHSISSSPGSRLGTGPAALESSTGNRPVPLRPANLTGMRAAVILYSYYPSDPRPRRAAEAMAEAGMEVDLYCLSEGPGEPSTETIRGVNVFRLRMKRRRDSKLIYIYQYALFLLAAGSYLTRRSLRVRYQAVHVHNMPDVLVFAALVPRLLGARIILDLHDPMPELMMSIYQLATNHPGVRLLRFLERRSIAFADLALTPNLAFRDLFVSRGCPPDKMQIVMNSPEETIFNPERIARPAPAASALNGEFRLMHHGSLVHRHGIDVLIEAVAIVRKEIPAIHLDIYGSRTEFLDTIESLIAKHGLKDCIIYHGPHPQPVIAEAITQCDLGIVPNRRSVFTEINFPTRLFEYLSMGRPVIAPNTRGIRDYFTEREICFFEPGDPEDLARQIIWVRNHPQEAQAMVERGREIYRSHLWSRERSHFIRLVEGMLRNQPASDAVSRTDA